MGYPKLRSAAICLVGLLAVLTTLPLKPAHAAEKALPRIPKIVSELYLPEEQQASSVLYKMYAALPAAELAKLHGGGRVYVGGKVLDSATRRKIAAWFNSARWGCKPPEEQVTAESVRQATAAFISRDQVVDFSLQSPRRQIWKTLTIACGPTRAEWVRDGLPLLPFYIMTPWPGGTDPSYPRPPVRGCVSAWKVLRHAYAVYAELPPAKLRQLHQTGALGIRFADLSKQQQQAIVNARDISIASLNTALFRKSNFSRSPALRARHFGITRVDFTYARSQPNCPYGSPQGVDGLVPIPRPYRAIFLVYDPLSDEYGGGPPTKKYLEPDSGAGRDYGAAFCVAIPAEAQRKYLRWSQDMQAWRGKWETPDGYRKPGAPPFLQIRDYF